MRVAIVAESFLPNVNGVTNSVLRILEYLQSEGHEALVICADVTAADGTRTPEFYRGARIHRVPSVEFPRITSLPVAVPWPGVTRAISDFRADVVHLASPFVLGTAGVVAAKKLGLPLVAVYQTDVAGFAAHYGYPAAARWAWRWLAALHRRCDLTLAPSTAAMEDLARYDIPHVVKWGRGIDTERFRPEARSEELRRRWAPDGRPIVGYVGRLAPEKSVRRFSALADRLGPDGDLALVLVGDGPERPLLMQDLPFATFTGQLGGEELAQAFASFDVFVHTGLHETFCQTVQEALASGVPAVVPAVGGPRDLVTDGVTGRLLSPVSFDRDLAGAITDLTLDSDKETRRIRAHEARASVAPRSWQALCSDLVEHYASVITHCPRHAGWGHLAIG